MQMRSLYPSPPLGFAATAAVVIAGLCAAPAAGHAAPAPAKVVTRGDVTFLQTPDGRTLYTYAKDPRGAHDTACTDKCAQIWPPFVAKAGTEADSDWKIISGNGGAPQWAYKGRPLYTFFEDTHPGEMLGQNYQGHAWQVATP